MPAHTTTPREVFERWLEQQPDTARVVLACDTDHSGPKVSYTSGSTRSDPRGLCTVMAGHSGNT